MTVKEPISIHRQGATDTRTGQRAPGATEPARALIAPGSSDEQGNVLTSGLTLYLDARQPALGPTDRVTARGQLWSVVGEPAEHRSAYGRPARRIAYLKRASA